MDDTISRQAAIEIVDFECGGWRGLAYNIEKRLSDLPPAQPERLKGKWIIGKYRLTCSQCRFTYPNKLMNKLGVVNYCPNCGADMRGEEDGKIS